MLNPDEEFDKWIDRMYGEDPASAVMAQNKVTTAVPGSFSMDAPPKAKNNSPKPEDEESEDDGSEADDSPFIDDNKRAIKVTPENEIDWSDQSKNILKFFDIIQSALFGFVAMADSDERRSFRFSDEDMQDLTGLITPIAQKHNIKIGPEWVAGVVLIEVMARNGERAFQMRKEKKQIAKDAARELEETQMHVIKDKG